LPGKISVISSQKEMRQETKMLCIMGRSKLPINHEKDVRQEDRAVTLMAIVGSHCPKELNCEQR